MPSCRNRPSFPGLPRQWRCDAAWASVPPHWLIALTYHDLPDGCQYPREVLADPRQRIFPWEQPEAVEFRQQCSVGECKMRGAGQALWIGQLRRLPHEQGQVFAAQIGMYAEIGELLGRDRKAGFFEQFACSADGKGFARLRNSLGNVPARRPRRMSEQDAFPVRDDDAAARPAPNHGRVPPAETPP